MVPLMMPITRRIGSPRRLSRRARTMGMPPATAASNNRSTPASSAVANSSVPTLASSSLLPVMTGLPLRSAVVMNSRAGSMPPISSTITSMDGSLTTAIASRVSMPSGSEISRSLLRLRTATATTSSRTPVRASMAACWRATSETSGAPTLPQPRTPILMSFTASRLRGRRRPAATVCRRFADSWPAAPRGQE